jgi:tyrosine-specific transport protein
MLFIGFWAIMYYSALLFLEVCLHFPGETNMVSMARKTLGPWGEVATWVIYLFLLYALTAAYLAGAAPLWGAFFKGIFGVDLPWWLAPIPMVLVFGYFVVSGTASVDKINRWLMAGLGVTFVAIFVTMGGYFQKELLGRIDFRELPLALSMAATAFGFHIVIPSLCSYLDRDPKKIKRALFWGSFLPLVVYLLWEGLALGIVPLGGENGLLAGYERGDGAFILMGKNIGRVDLILLASLFAFFSIVTSFLGVSLSLSDFLADGLHVRRVGAPSWVVDLLTFVPPLMFVLIEPRAFFMALDLAGAYGVILLLLVIPILMAWSLRYSEKGEGVYRAPGGKFLLVIGLIFSAIVVVNQLYLQWNGYL